MELKITQKTEEPLLSRMKVDGTVEFDAATPSTKDIKNSVAKSLGKTEDLIEVEGIYNTYGDKKASIVCYAYENSEIIGKLRKLGKKAKEKIEKQNKEAKEEVKEEPKAEEKPAEKKEASEEKPKEEKKE